MDEIRVKGLKVYAYHGVRADEEKNGQEFSVDITAFLSTKEAGRSDDLETENFLSSYIPYLKKRGSD